MYGQSGDSQRKYRLAKPLVVRLLKNGSMFAIIPEIKIVFNNKNVT